MDSRTDRLTGAEDVAWNLSDLYASVDDPAINRDMDEADARADELTARYRGRVAALSATELRDLLDAYEALGNLAGRVGSFAMLGWSANTEDPARGALMQRATERGSRLGQKLVWFELE